MLMPQRGYVCKAQGCRALPATPGKGEGKRHQPQRGCGSPRIHEADATALRLVNQIVLFPG
jgi:hypothetical protein